MAFIRKVVEVARMNAHIHFAQQTNGQILITPEHRNAENHIPAALDQQSCARRAAHELAVESRKIHAQSIEQNGLDLLALIEQYRSSELYGSIHGKESIGNDFEASSTLDDLFIWSAGSHPSKFHLWERGNLGDSTESEG